VRALAPPCCPRAPLLTRRLLHARSEMYHPAAGVKEGSDGKLHVNRPWGFYQATLPGEAPQHVRYHRDINAAVNMLKLFRQLYHEGDVPLPFLQATPRTELLLPAALRYKYAQRRGSRRLWRTMASA
jgi:hypothetical protein